MGREVRRVEANWEHPKEDNGNYHPMFDETFDDVLKEWVDSYELWKKGEHPDQSKYPNECKDKEYWEWDNEPPNPRYYRPKFMNTDWYQIYETVSEGTPVTPPFATKEELIEYLVKHGDFSDQKKGDGGWSIEIAKEFVGVGWAPSLIVTRTADKVEILKPRDGQPLDKKEVDDE